MQITAASGHILPWFSYDEYRLRGATPGRLRGLHPAEVHSNYKFRSLKGSPPTLPVPSLLLLLIPIIHLVLFLVNKKAFPISILSLQSRIHLFVCTDIHLSSLYAGLSVNIECADNRGIRGTGINRRRCSLQMEITEAHVHELRIGKQ